MRKHRSSRATGFDLFDLMRTRLPGNDSSFVDECLIGSVPDVFWSLFYEQSRLSSTIYNSNNTPDRGQIELRSTLLQL